MCVIMSTTSAVTPTVLHQSSTQTCALPTQPNPSAINPSLRSHPRQKPKSHKSSQYLLFWQCQSISSNPSVLSDVRMQCLIVRNAFVSVFSCPCNLDLQCFFPVMLTSEKLMLDFSYLPFLQASLVTVIHLVSSVVDSVEKEGSILLLQCWLLGIYVVSVWWVIIRSPKCHFLHLSYIYKEKEIKND